MAIMISNLLASLGLCDGFVSCATVPGFNVAVAFDNKAHPSGLVVSSKQVFHTKLYENGGFPHADGPDITREGAGSLELLAHSHHQTHLAHGRHVLMVDVHHCGPHD